jgi:5'-nucleotidase
LDQFGQPYFWLTGEFSDMDKRPDTDLQALKHGFVSVVPTQYDLTAYAVIEKYKSLEDES